MTRRRFILLAVVALALVAVLSWPAGADGPWKLQVVDTETGRPLADVVVLSVWTKTSANWPHPERTYHDVDEAVSDANGRFVIPSRDLSKNSVLSAIVGPRLEVFKSGYGAWRFKDDVIPPHPSADQLRQRARERWERAAREGVVIELQPVKTPEERRRALPHCHPEAGDIPLEKIPHWLAACNAERASHGLQPYGGRR